MHNVDLPENEERRLAKLNSLGILDTLPQRAFDDITALASAICGTPISLISFIDKDRQWFKSSVGIDIGQTPREVAFCSHAILHPDEVMVVEDATLDPRFHDNPLVSDDPSVRFYAGAPIVTDDGFALGTVCVIDQQSRQLDPSQLQSLRSLANLVVTLVAHEKRSRDERLAQAAEVNSRNEYLTAMTASGLDLMSFLDANYIYRYVNKSYLEYWARDPKDILGKSVAELVGDDLFQTKVKPHFDRALAGQQVDFEATVDFLGVGPRHVEITYLPARDESGNITGVVVRVHSIHALQQREDQLRDTVAMLEHKTLEQARFIHIVSHDLREPINTINNFTSLLSGDSEPGLSEGGKRYLAFVAAGGQRMKTLLDDLLGFLQLEHHAVEKQRVDLARLASEIRDDLAAALASSRGRIEFGHLPMVYGEPSLLRIALQNLVSNGLKFTADGIEPEVRIEAATESERMVISVHDNGIGIAYDQTHRIFDMFQRLHTRKKYKGTGLGLSIVRRVAELHGGQIAVTSEPGKGSCFTLTLPTAPHCTQEKDGHEYL
jgi:signal transduction histidine kinase